MAWRGVIEEYRSFLPVAREDQVVTLLEGNTPLIRSARLEKELGGARLYLKLEGANPTGSFKDRGMTLAVTRARSQGARAVICASTGNTSASAAAYASRAGLASLVILPEGAVAAGKLAQALIHGARIIPVEGNFDHALDIVREVVARHPEVALVNSINPFRIPGQRTAAFEICDVLGTAPDFLAIPVGNGGNVTAYWEGFVAYRKAGKIGREPRLLGFQATGAAPLVHGHPVPDPRTRATAIRIGNPVNWEKATEALRESRGRVVAVTDEEIARANRLIASQEGIFVEPASAASVAGVLKLAAEGFFHRGDVVVVVLTGHGLKDPDFVREVTSFPEKVPARTDLVEEVMLEHLATARPV